MAWTLKRIDDRRLREAAEVLAILSPAALVVSAQEFVMSAVTVLFLFHSWLTRDFRWAREPWFAALAALWAFSLVRTSLEHSSATGVLMALQWIHFGIYAAALATWILPFERARRRLAWVAAATVGFYAFDCLFQFAFGFDVIGRRPWMSRMTSVFSKPGVGAEIAWLAVPAIAHLHREGRRWATSILAIAATIAVILSGDRMGLLDLAAAGAMTALLFQPLRRPALIALPILVAVAAGLLAANPTLRERQFDSTVKALSNFSGSNYGLVFKSGFDVALAHPWFGVGTHNYQMVCLEPKYGPPTVGDIQEARCQGHPHNIYLLWFAETGILGLALFCAFVGLSMTRLVGRWSSRAGDVVFVALFAAVALRFWPFTGGTSFYSSWSAEPMFLMLGWALAIPAAGQGKA